MSERTPPDAPADTDTPWLSVLVPVFNARPHLSKCLESLAAQGLAGVEVLCLDDASDDGSLEMLEAFARRLPGALRVIAHKRRLGVAVARNHLLDASVGEFVWFVDADDMMRQGAIDSLRDVIVRHQPDLVLCDFRVLREHTRWRHRLRGESHRRTFAGPSGRVLTDGSEVLAGLFDRGEFHVWSKIARRTSWPADLRFPDGRYFEDLALVPLLVTACARTIHVPEPWITYRSHPGSALGSIDAHKLDDWWTALHAMGKRLAARPDLAPRARAALADFVAISFARMCRVARARGLGAEWASSRRALLHEECAMPSGLLAARCRLAGRRWRQTWARAPGTP